MSNNISDVLAKEIEKLMKNKFFFKQPSNSKVLTNSAIYLLLTVIGSLVNFEILAAFLSVFPLTYVLGAKGLRYYLPLIITGGAMLSVVASPSMIVWYVIHMVIAYIIYKTILLRGSKIFLVAASTTVIFSGIALYIFISIKIGKIVIDSKQILEFINTYVNSMVEMNQGVDKNLVLESFSNMQKSFPVTLFIMLLVYSLVLVHYTLSMLAREFVIIPVFPKFSRIMVSSKSAYTYIVVTIITLFQNITGILSLAFILNGLFTAFFFLEQKSKSTIGKPILFLLMVIFSPIFELLGFIDSVFKLREGYIIMKRGR